MNNKLLAELLTLGLYVLFIGFCFCDGFKLHILRKLLWFLVFLFMAVSTFKSGRGYALSLILPLPTLLALLLCKYEQVVVSRRREDPPGRKERTHG